MAPLVKKYGGSKVLLHYGGKSALRSGLLDKISTLLREGGVDFVTLGGVVPNPRLSLVHEGIKLCQQEGVDFILAVGGGSVIDSGKAIALYKRGRVLVDEIHVPQQITGYEYQFAACRQALLDGLLEPREMPLQETLYVMQLMDELRRKWGVRYPMDN